MGKIEGNKGEKRFPVGNSSMSRLMYLKIVYVVCYGAILLSESSKRYVAGSGKGKKQS